MMNKLQILIVQREAALLMLRMEADGIHPDAITAGLARATSASRKAARMQKKAGQGGGGQTSVQPSVGPSPALNARKTTSIV